MKLPCLQCHRTFCTSRNPANSAEHSTHPILFLGLQTIAAMETVFCECKKCDSAIGRFANLWTQIGKSYFSPVVEPEDELAIQSHGTVRIGERGTLVEEWSALVCLLYCLSVWNMQS